MYNFKGINSIHICLFTINSFVLYQFINKGQVAHGIGYFLFFYTSLVIVHLFSKRYPPKLQIELKKPKTEFYLFLLLTILGAILISMKFALQESTMTNAGILNILVLIGIIAFSFPTCILLYLVNKKYRNCQLGLCIKPRVHILLGLIVWSLTGTIAFLFNRSGIIWERAYYELGGIGGILIQGAIGSALVEEFSRFAIQTRAGKILKPFDYNILLATTIWALIHLPVAYHNSNNIASSMIYCIQIIPIGYVWGYMLDKTRSIIPSVFAHGFNLWGLQNG